MHFGGTHLQNCLSLIGCNKLGSSEDITSSWNVSDLKFVAACQGNKHHKGVCMLEATLREPHCRLEYCSFITAGPCVFHLWHMHGADPDSHTRTQANRRSLSDSLVLLMSRARFKQGHLCRTSQAEEKSQLRSIMRTSFNFLFLPQRSQHVLQIITRQQNGFLNKYPRCVSLILNSLAVSDAFLPHSQNANQIVVWPFSVLPQARKTLKGWHLSYRAESNK